MATIVTLLDFDTSSYDRCRNSRTFNSNASKPTGGIGSGVDVDSVGHDLRLGDWRMTMYDDFVETLLMKKEIVSNPEKILFPLVHKGHSGANARMNKEKIPTAE
jgi:hypothetical protein